MLSEWPCHGRHEVPFVHPYNSYADQLAENVAIFASLLSSIFLKSKLCISPFSVSSIGRDHYMSSSNGIRPTQQCSSLRLAVAIQSQSLLISSPYDLGTVPCPGPGWGLGTVHLSETSVYIQYLSMKGQVWRTFRHVSIVIDSVTGDWHDRRSPCLISKTCRQFWH